MRSETNYFVYKTEVSTYGGYDVAGTRAVGVQFVVPSDHRRVDQRPLIVGCVHVSGDRNLGRGGRN